MTNARLPWQHAHHEAHVFGSLFTRHGRPVQLDGIAIHPYWRRSAKRGLAGFVTLASVMGSGAELQSQAPRSFTIGGAPGCAGCKVEISPVVSLEDSTSGPNLLFVGAWATNGRGQFYTHGPSEFQIAVWNDAGKLQRLVGAKGSGPDDFRFIKFLRVGPGDSLWVYDDGLRRVSVLSPSTLRVIRSFSVAHRLATFTVLSNSVLVGTTIRPPKGSQGRSAFVVAPADQPVRWVGGRLPVFSESLVVAQPQVVAKSAAPGRYWIAASASYTIEQRDTANRVYVTLTRDASWFHPRADGLVIGGSTQPAIAYMREDAQGLLWVWIRRSRGMAKPLPEMSVKELALVPARSQYTLEIIDPDNGTLVFSGHYDSVYHFLGESQLIQAIRRSDFGGLQVFSARLVRH